MKKEKAMIEVTIDLIKELRFQKQFEEAEAMLKEYHRQKKKAGKQAVKNEFHKDYQIKKAKGICKYSYCFNPICEESICLCKYHLIKQRKYCNKMKLK